MSKPKVLVADPIAQRGIDELSNGGLLDVTVKIGLKPDELLAIIAQSSSLELLLLDDLTEEGLRNLTSSPGLGRIQVSYPDRAALSWPEHIHGWRISSHMGDGSWYFTREVRKERKAKE